VKEAAAHEDGFTLVELLVVMIVLGILAAIAIPTFLSQKERARTTGAKADLVSLSREVESSLTDGPPAVAVVIPAVSGPGTTSFSVNGESYSSRVSGGVTVGGQIGATGDYCLEATTADYVVTWKVEAGHLVNAAC
jgi:prepilin-type N-terminal cleavage/methylation domain-containing protein